MSFLHDRLARRKMKVLMTTDTVGGVWTYTVHLAGALTERDVDVTLVSLGALPTKSQMLDLKDLGGVELIPTPFKLEWMKDSDADVEASKRFLMDVADHVKPDIFHSNQFCYSTLRLGVPRVVVAHSDMLSWWSWRFYAGADFQLDPFLADYQAKVRRALLAADAVVCPSAFMASNLRRFYDRGLRNISVIYNGIPAVGGLPSQIKKKRMAVMVGRLWDQGKNAACVIQAASMLPDMEFLLVGPTSGPDGNTLEAEPTANVQMLGKKTPEQVRRLMERAAIYIGPSIYEPFGLSPLEAAVSSCALILSDTPSFNEIWEDAAVYFPPNEPEVLAERLKGIVSKPDIICRHATMARYRAFRFYTAGKMAEQYLNLYQALIDSPNRSSVQPNHLPHAC